MGGTALGFQAERLSAKDYFALVSNIIYTFNLGWMGNPRECSLLTIPAYSKKESFGDADLIFVGSAADWQTFGEDVGRFVPAFTGDTYRNGNVLSVGVATTPGEIFQVDFIYGGETRASARTMQTYFAYNDLGNLMGRVAHRMGLRWGQDGLSYVLRSPENGDRIIGEYNFTDVLGVEESFEIMGYSPLRWSRGFQTLEEIFKYVADNPCFSPEIYLLHNRNAISRIRDSKRKTYSLFLKWVEENAETLPSLSLTEKERDFFKAQIFNELCIKYPGFAKWYHNAMTSHYLRQRAAIYLNGTEVGNMSGLQGKDLGGFMTELRTELLWHLSCETYGYYEAGAAPDSPLNRMILDNPGLIKEAVGKLVERKKSENI